MLLERTVGDNRQVRSVVGVGVGGTYINVGHEIKHRTRTSGAVQLIPLYIRVTISSPANIPLLSLQLNP